jgi:hypothetical protein
MTGLRGLSSRLRYDSRKWWTIIGLSIQTLEISGGISDRSVRDARSSGFIYSILANAPNLTKFEMPYACVEAGLLALLPGPLKYLCMSIWPTHVDVLKGIHRFENLETLHLIFHEDDDIEGSDSFHDVLLPDIFDPLHMPTVQEFHLIQHLKPLGANVIMRYIARSRFCEDCAFLFSLHHIPADSGLIPLLNPLFESHASTRVDFSVSLIDTPEVTQGSLIFSRARSVYFNHMPALELFKAARLPSVVEVVIHELEQHEDELRDVLSALISSPHVHDMRLVVQRHPEIFTWKPYPEEGPEWSASPHSQFVGDLLRYLGPLRRKGVALIDSFGRTFQDCYKDMFDW